MTDSPDASSEPGARARWTDHQVEAFIGTLLRAGVLLAAAIVFAGGALYLARYGAQAPQYASFRGAPAELRTVSGILRQAVTLHSRAVMQLGLLVLIATPVARVALSLYAFARQRDRLYVGVTSLVLLLLLLSLTGVIA